MNRVLIVAGERQTGERFQQALSESGFQTAVVWNPMQMVDFCRQHAPDFLIVDLDLAEFGLWNGIQAVKGIGTLANIPYLGIISASNPQLLEKAKAAGFCSVFPTHDGVKPVIAMLQSKMSENQEAVEAEEQELVVSRDPSLNRLRELTRDIIGVTARLKPNVEEFGEDGPELFGYIEDSGRAIRTKLKSVDDFALHDKELRHDFRNMIGSVTGFAELILMEPGISQDSQGGLKHLREMSKEFVEILDNQKAEASA